MSDSGERRQAAALLAGGHWFAGTIELGSQSLRFVPHEHEPAAPVLTIDLRDVVWADGPAGRERLLRPFRNPLRVELRDGRTLVFEVWAPRRWATAITYAAAIAHWTVI